jgi:lipoate synthase
LHTTTRCHFCDVMSNATEKTKINRREDAALSQTLRDFFWNHFVGKAAPIGRLMPARSLS